MEYDNLRYFTMKSMLELLKLSLSGHSPLKVLESYSISLFSGKSLKTDLLLESFGI